MTWEAWLTVAVVLGMTWVIARDRLGPDLAMFSAVGVLTLFGVLDGASAVAGFANPAIVTIGTLFVVAAAVRETGALQLITSAIFGRTRSARIGLARLVVPTAVLSGFLNNTPIVAMFIPAVKEFSRKVGQSPSRFLMPLAYAAMLGGTCTLIGTSANLVVSGQLQARGLEPLGMFEIGWAGVPTALVGVVYLLLVAPRLLAARTTLRQSIDNEAREYLAEVEVTADSPLIAKTIEDAGLRQLPGLFLVEIRRDDGRVVTPVAPEDRLEAGDHLVFSGLGSTVKDLRAFPGLVPVDEPDMGPDVESLLWEVVLSHRSTLVGKTVRDTEFRRRFDAAILAVHRSGERIHQRIGDIVLRPGDTLMLSASPGFGDAWKDSQAFYLVSHLPAAAPPRYTHANLTLAVLAALVLLPTLTRLTLLEVALGALVVLLATGSVTPRNARRAVDWSILLVIGSALGLAQALETTGAARTVAHGLVSLTASMGPVVLLAGIYLLALGTASLLTNAAAAALVFPVAITAAEAAQLDARPFCIAVALAASAAFATPVGSNAILLVHGPGGYRYRDFLRVGLPLNVLCLAVMLLCVPWFWPLQPV